MNFLESYRGKRVLVTGHTGFKGGWLVQMLLLLGAEVTGFALPPETDESLYALLHPEREMRSILGDVRDMDALQKAFAAAKPEMVFHLAAQPIVRTSYEKPRLTYETNVMGTVNVLECVRTCGEVGSFLNVTTDKVYLNRENAKPFTEEEPLDGFDPYSNSKSCSELVTHSYQKSFFSDQRVRISTARAGNVIGGGDFARDRIVPDCVRAAAGGRPIAVRNPYSTRPYQHVLDPLYAYLMIAAMQLIDAKFAGYYNVGPDEADCVNTGRLATLFCEAWGDGVRWENHAEANAPHEASFLRLDNTRLKTVFGWQPRMHIASAVQKTVDWTKAWRAGADMTDVTRAQIAEFYRDGGSLCSRT